METYFVFIAKASCCLSIFYLASLIFFINDNAFKLQRFYLLVSILISLALPFNQFSINFFKETESIVALKQQPEIQMEPKTIAEPVVAKISSQIQPIQQVRNVFPLTIVLGIVYWVVVAGLLLRIFYSLGYIVIYFIRSERIKEGRYTIVFHPSINGSFSFLRWIFIHGDIKHTGESQSIIKHEIVHADQYHSLDVIAVELLTAVMWFNPLVWLMRKGMQQLHEYLADEGVVRSGTNVLEYQALLVNQVAGDRLICLPSGFNQSLIKKRLVMMTKPSINQNKWYQLLALIPLAGLMFIVLSFTNKKMIPAEKNVQQKPLTVYNLPKKQIVINVEDTKKQGTISVSASDTLKESNSISQMPAPPPPPASSDVVAAVSPTRMNVFYLGVDNPVSIAVSGIPSDKLLATIDNGTISKVGNSYIVKPDFIGKAIISIYMEKDGKQILKSTAEFRVKIIPNPIARVAGKKGGSIARTMLLAQREVLVDLESFDFDAKFEVKEFTIAADINGVKQIISTKSNIITDDQKSLIKNVKLGDYVYFQDIKVAGPDGKFRNLPSIAFQIQD